MNDIMALLESKFNMTFEGRRGEIKELIEAVTMAVISGQ